MTEREKRDRVGGARPTGRADIPHIGDVFVRELRRILGDNLHSAVIYGAAAFPDTLPTGDIDFHVILHRPLTDTDRAALEAMHEALAERFPPLGAEMDGYYILLDDARGASPPRSELWARATDEAWALHREHIRAGRCLVLTGPGPLTIYRRATWPELEEALLGELDYVKAHLFQYPDYCVLNLCRLLYSFETRDVVQSKAGAARWALEALPEWSGAIRWALASYAGTADPNDRERMTAQVTALFAAARTRIASQRQDGPEGD